MCLRPRVTDSAGESKCSETGEYKVGWLVFSWHLLKTSKSRIKPVVSFKVDTAGSVHILLQYEFLCLSHQRRERISGRLQRCAENLAGLVGSTFPP